MASRRSEKYLSTSTYSTDTRVSKPFYVSLDTFRNSYLCPQLQLQIQHVVKNFSLLLSFHSDVFMNCDLEQIVSAYGAFDTGMATCWTSQTN